MVQYLARFLLNLANYLKPSRKLTRKGEEWNWSAECEATIQIVKKNLYSQKAFVPILKFYELQEEIILQIDSSKAGIGVLLMQNNRPLEYASRALTASEKRWAQIEKETLSIVFG